MLTGLAYRPDGELVPVSLIIVVLVWLVLFTGQATQRAIVDLQFARMQGADIWYKFDEAGFRCGMPNAEARLEWPRIVAAIETATQFIILESGIVFYTVPKRSLAEGDVISLQKLLTANIHPYIQQHDTKRVY
jgi:hypothetical protein